MDNNDAFEEKIRTAVTNINQNAIDTAPQSNWIGVLGRSENISSSSNKLLLSRKYKILSAAASVLLVIFVGTLLITTLDEDKPQIIRTADSTTTTAGKEIESTASTTQPIPAETVVSVVPSTSQNPKTTQSLAPTTLAPARPANPSNPQFTGRDVVNPGNPGTYTVYFSWNPSPTPGVKYCVGTTSHGSSQIFPNCSISNPYLVNGTSTGFGLVFETGVTYQFQVTAVDANDRKSDTIYLNWQLP